MKIILNLPLNASIKKYEFKCSSGNPNLTIDFCREDRKFFDLHCLKGKPVSVSVKARFKPVHN